MTGGVVAVMAVVVIAAVVGLGLLLYTPTITIHIRNDTTQRVTVSSCGSDPATVSPGRSVDVDPNPHDASAACVIYEGSSDYVIGCLAIPTTRFGDGATVKLSSMTTEVTAAGYGD